MDHRIRKPSETYALIEPFLREVGVTRLADLTGLDVGPVFTFSAIRPLALSLSLTQGKGIDPTQARVSAAMEAVEHYHAETPEFALRQCSFTRLPEAERPAWQALPGRLPRFSPTRPMAFVAGRRLVSGTRAWVPLDLVHFDLRTDGLSETPFFVPSSNGLASGNSVPEATAQALCEVIERHHTSAFFDLSAAEQELCRVRIETIDGKCGSLLASFEQSDVAATVWETTGTPHVPSFVCELIDHPGSPRQTLDARGFGCHVDRRIALQKAICEAAQSRVTLIAGARDDKTGLDSTQRAQRVQTAQDQWRSRRENSGARSFIAEGDVRRPSLEEQVAGLARAVVDAVGEEPILVDLSKPGWPVHVVRVVAPGLRFQTPESLSGEGTDQ